MPSCKQIMLMFTRWLLVVKKKTLIFVVFGVANHHPNCTKFDKARTKKKQTNNTNRQYRKSDIQTRCITGANYGRKSQFSQRTTIFFVVFRSRIYADLFSSATIMSSMLLG